MISDGKLVDDTFLDNCLFQCEDVDRLERLEKLFHRTLCEYDEAIQIYQRLTELLVAEHERNHQYVAGATPQLLTSINIRSVHVGIQSLVPDFEDLFIAAIIHNEIGKTSRLQGKKADALEKYKDVMSINLKIYGKDNISFIN